ncbi:phosphorylase family protein [Streptomyces sp. NPDC001177]
MPPRADVVVFTALGVESLAVREHLTGPLVEHEAGGALFEVGTFTGLHAEWRVACLETGEGNVAAAALFQRAVAEFRPRHVFFVGIAGGLKDVEPGDVVVARYVYDYERGKDTEDGFRARITTHLSTFALVQRAQAVARTPDWRKRITAPPPGGEPRVFVKPIAAGSKVVGHERSATARLLAEHCGDAVAVEMEGQGFLQAAYFNAGLEALVVRGISDRLSDKGEHNDRVWQPAASRHAAAFTFDVLSRLQPPEPRGHGLGRPVTDMRAVSRAAEGQSTIGFGPDHTVVVVSGNGSVERWDLDSGEPLPGAPGGGDLRFGHQAVVSPFRHSVAVARRQSLDLLHFAGRSGEHRHCSVPLGGEEFLVAGGGDVLATHDRHRVALRGFDDGRILREVPCPSGLAASSISTDGSVVALATTNSVHVHRPGMPATEWPIRNRLEFLRPGCCVAVSPSGAYVACATFRELVVRRIADGSVVLRRDFSGQESRDGLGAKGMRLLCTDAGGVLWLRRGRLCQVTDSPEIRHLEQAGRYDDFAVHPDGGLLAAAGSQNLVRVWQWSG